MKSITAAYHSVLSPPGPFATVAVANRDGSIIIPSCGAQIDTAADWTVLPQQLIDQLGAAAIREAELVGFGGVSGRYPVFEVWVALPTFSPVLVEVTAHANEPWVLLGRDVLNRYRVFLDGPSLRVTIEEP